MRKLAARWLRRLAQKLAPLPRVESETPLEFITTLELAEEIRRRTDRCILFWGRFVIRPSGRLDIDGEIAFRTNPEEAEATLGWVCHSILQHYANRNGESE